MSNEGKRAISVLLGSTSDRDKIVPGLLRASKEISNLEINVIYASADNTPKKVNTALNNIMIKNEKPRVFISGAGLANVLTGVVKSYSAIDDLNIGIPISDSSSNGLSSLLSTCEKPPRNPVLTVGIDNSYAAINIANRFMNGLEKVALVDDKLISSSISEMQYSSLVKKFEEPGMPYELSSISKLWGFDVAVMPYSKDSSFSPTMIEEKLNYGNGVVVGVSTDPISSYIKSQYNAFTWDKSLKGTGIVSSQGYDNAVLMAAILTRNAEVLAKFGEYKSDKSRELDINRGMVISEGEITYEYKEQIN